MDFLIENIQKYAIKMCKNMPVQRNMQNMQKSILCIFSMYMHSALNLCNMTHWQPIVTTQNRGIC
jgi:hypothetical protein